MKKIMFMGKTGCGKTTLTQVLTRQEIAYKKTQDIQFSDSTIDTPGEYMENRRFYNALIVTSADCDIIAFLQDATDELSIFPPGFANTFEKHIIGIVTKTDLCKDEKEVERAGEFLREAGVKEIYHISSIENEGIENIINLLE